MLRYTTGSTFTCATVEQVRYLLADRRVTVQVLIRPVGLSRVMVGSSAAIWQLILLKEFQALAEMHIAKRVLWCHLSANLLGDHVVVFQTAWRAWKILYLYSSQVLLVIKQHRGYLGTAGEVTQSSLPVTPCVSLADEKNSELLNTMRGWTPPNKTNWFCTGALLLGGAGSDFTVICCEVFIVQTTQVLHFEVSSSNKTNINSDFLLCYLALYCSVSISSDFFDSWNNDTFPVTIKSTRIWVFCLCKETCSLYFSQLVLCWQITMAWNMLPKKPKERDGITTPGSIQKACGCDTCFSGEHDSTELMVGLSLRALSSLQNSVVGWS